MEKYIFVFVASTFPGKLSIHPKQRHSSTIAEPTTEFLPRSEKDFYAVLGSSGLSWLRFGFRHDVARFSFNEERFSMLENQNRSFAVQRLVAFMHPVVPQYCLPTRVRDSCDNRISTQVRTAGALRHNHRELFQFIIHNWQIVTSTATTL